MAREEIKSGQRVVVNLMFIVERLSRFGEREKVGSMFAFICLSAASDVR